MTRSNTAAKHARTAAADLAAAHAALSDPITPPATWATTHAVLQLTEKLQRTIEQLADVVAELAAADAIRMDDRGNATEAAREAETALRNAAAGIPDALLRPLQDAAAQLFHMEAK